jgi:hypothetical protein
MLTEIQTDGNSRSLAVAFDVRAVFSALRAMVGLLSWVSPSTSWRVFGMGATGLDARSPLVTRLFGAREIALAAGLQSPNPAIRKAVLQTGLFIDGADIVASVIALRRGAPKWIWLTFVAGASTFVGLGIGGLAKEERMSRT